MALVIRTLLAGVALATLTVLTGCGVAPDVHPGAAAVVDGEEIRIDAVDELAEDLCATELQGLEAEGIAVPMSLVRSQAAELLVTEHLAGLYAAELGLDAGTLASGARDLAAEALVEEAAEAEAVGGEPSPAGLRDELLEQRTRDAFLALVFDRAGKEDLGFAPEGPTTEQTVRRGLELFTAWRDGVEVSKDPRFDVPADGTSLVPTARSLSVLVDGSPVRSGFTEQGGLDQAYLATLPEGQLCGTPRR